MTRSDSVLGGRPERRVGARLFGRWRGLSAVPVWPIGWPPVPYKLYIATLGANVRICRRESVPKRGLAPPDRASSRSSVLGSAPATSSIFARLRAPATSVTEPRPTPNAAATDASTAAVAWPSTARSLTRTTRAPSCSPPTLGRAEPGRTRTAIRTPPVCARTACHPPGTQSPRSSLRCSCRCERFEPMAGSLPLA
jgi:hypothetical protein